MTYDRNLLKISSILEILHTVFFWRNSLIIFAAESVLR